MRDVVVAPSLTDQVYNAIVNDICSGDLPPGTRLRQEALAERYGVSRQPVQQALLLLRSQGFTRETGRRGLEVAVMDPAEVDNLYRTRAVIEGFAARVAADSARPEDLERGVELLRRGQEALEQESLSRAIAADLEFHQFIASLSRDPTLQEVSAVVLRNVRRLMAEVIVLSGYHLASGEHTGILAAIRDQDPEAAEARAREHAERGRRVVAEHSLGGRPGIAP